MPRVSIIIPAYNVEHFVSHAVESALAQTYQDCEVLIPMNEAIVQNADHTKKEIYVTLPTGLLEVYIAPKADIPDDAD